MIRVANRGKNVVGAIIAGFIFGPLFICVGAGIAFWVGKPMIDDAKRSENWPNVPGVIESSEVTSSRNSEGDTMYSPEIEYRYEVDGQEHKSNQVNYGGDWSTSSSSPPRKVSNRYPVGKEVDVYYNPELPAESVLETGTSWSTYTVFWIGLVFLLGGLLALSAPVLMIGRLILGGAVLGGAVAGMIGKKPGSTSGGHDQPPRRDPAQDIDDDAFDIS